MDDRTERLRDLFETVTGTGETTESQRSDRGTLVSNTPIEDRLRAIIESMLDREPFATDFATDTYVDIVTGYYGGASDEALAESLELTTATVRRARFDLHLLRSHDWPLDADPGTIRAASDETPHASVESLSPESRELANSVLTVLGSITTSNRRYLDQFEELLDDGDVTNRFVAEAHRDGLEGATEDMENRPPL